MITKVNDAVVHQPLRDLLTLGLTNRNHNKKNVGSVTASDTGLRISTAGDFAIGGVMYNKAASSAVFALTGVNIEAGKTKRIALMLDTSGAGTVLAGDAVANGSTPGFGEIPATKCCIADVVIAAAAAFTGGTTTFSQVISAGGSVTIRDLAGGATIS